VQSATETARTTPKYHHPLLRPVPFHAATSQLSRQSPADPNQHTNNFRLLAGQPTTEEQPQCRCCWISECFDSKRTGLVALRDPLRSGEDSSKSKHCAEPSTRPARTNAGSMDVTRRQVATRLSKSISTVRRLERRALHPQRDTTGLYRFQAVPRPRRECSTVPVTLLAELVDAIATFLR
jgi:hypothetical protein